MVVRSHKELQTLAEAYLMFFPEKMMKQLGDVKDIYIYRHLLKQIGYNEKILSHLVSLTVSALEAHRRFRVQDTIKVLKSQIVHSDSPLPDAIVHGLFKIYQRLILSSREEMQWHLSRLIKNQILYLMRRLSGWFKTGGSLIIL